jgi:hypothetical protein
MKIDGACHCGRIAYEAEIDPERVRVCHCSDCQQLTGTVYRVSAPTPEENFRILKGTPKIYVKTADSGAQRAQAFCGDCGSPIYATSVGDGPRAIGIRVGTVRQRAQLAPKRQHWCGSALPWLDKVPDLPVDPRG